MKELSIEEKAKRYDEAIERAIELHDKWIDEDGKDVALMIFPELKESEDERIRKHLIKHFENKSKEDWNGVPVKNILAWLEKQGEQKPTERVEINKSLSDAVITGLNKYNGENYWKSPWALDSTGLKYPLYFANLGATWQKEQNPAWSEEDELYIRELESLVKQVWATAEHKNDKDAIHKMSDLSFFLKTLKPQLKQEWSEEDEYMINFISEKLFSLGATPLCSEIKWLKSLKDRYIWKPSDEQIECLSSHIAHREKDESSYSLNVLRDLLEQLKKLREE